MHTNIMVFGNVWIHKKIDYYWKAYGKTIKLNGRYGNYARIL